VGADNTSHPVHFSGYSELRKWLALGYVDFAEIFKGYGEATIRVREAGCTTAEGFDKGAVTYERCWCLETQKDQADLAWILVYSLRPKVVHMGTPCTRMSQMGQRDIDPDTRRQNEFTRKVALHQDAEGLGASVENPRGSMLTEQKEFVESFGNFDAPKLGWAFYREEGCQLRVVYPGRDEPGRPIQKAVFWMANFDLSAMELRCRYPAALAGAGHKHRHIRGTMYVEGEGSQSVASYTGKYVPEQATVYAKSVATFCKNTERITGPRRWRSLEWCTELLRLANTSKVASLKQPESEPTETLGAHAGHGKQYLLCQDGQCIDLDSGSSGALQPSEPRHFCPAAGAAQRTPKPVDQFHKVTADQKESWYDTKDITKSSEAEVQARRESERHEKEVVKADMYWREIAKAKDWNTVKADLSVYRYAGKEEVKEDPRITEDYKKLVVTGLGYAEGAVREGMTAADCTAVREVLMRKAGAFWVEDTPRTALRYLLHDTIPTGPPCRTPPMRLRGEEADWVDAQLQAEVVSGQLERGNSEWASPPFATKEFAQHRRQRKRRLVIDYRRVNQRLLRAIYFVRSADGVVQEVAGSAYMTFVDACKGFNQIANTRRAREMLAILARSGQFLT